MCVGWERGVRARSAAEAKGAACVQGAQPGPGVKAQRREKSRRRSEAGLKTSRRSNQVNLAVNSCAAGRTAGQSPGSNRRSNPVKPPAARLLGVAHAGLLKPDGGEGLGKGLHLGLERVELGHLGLSFSGARVCEWCRRSITAGQGAGRVAFQGQNPPCSVLSQPTEFLSRYSLKSLSLPPDLALTATAGVECRQLHGSAAAGPATQRECNDYLAAVGSDWCLRKSDMQQVSSGPKVGVKRSRGLNPNAGQTRVKPRS